MQELFDFLRQRFEASAPEERHADLAFIAAPREHIVPLLHHLKTREGYTHLSFITVVDRLEDGLFQLVYMLVNPQRHHRLGVQVFTPRTEAVADSVHDLWEQAATYQRELREMFGVNFPGSPRVDVPLILEGWDEIPPMRRDFDTRAYSERTYFPRPGRQTTDPRRRMNEALHPHDTWETGRHDA